MAKTQSCWGKFIPSEIFITNAARLPHPHLTPYFLVSLTPLVQISFSSQPSAAIKIKDGGHDFR